MLREWTDNFMVNTTFISEQVGKEIMAFIKNEDSRICGGDNNVTSRREQGISMQKPSSTTSARE